MPAFGFSGNTSKLHTGGSALSARGYFLLDLHSNSLTVTSTGIESGDVPPIPDSVNMTLILEKLTGAEARIEELMGHIKRLEAHLPATVVAVIAEALHDPETLKLMKKLVNNFEHLLRFEPI